MVAPDEGEENAARLEGFLAASRTHQGAKKRIASCFSQALPLE